MFEKTQGVRTSDGTIMEDMEAALHYELLRILKDSCRNFEDMAGDMATVAQAYHHAMSDQKRLADAPLVRGYV